MTAKRPAPRSQPLGFRRAGRCQRALGADDGGGAGERQAQRDKGEDDGGVEEAGEGVVGEHDVNPKFAPEPPAGLFM